ncbi:MAG: NAD(P)H-dependent oxidoreductase subunit E [Burkholderiales bacterium]|nr:NAD(P)H-dependent oxidoreductase subunit E [Burkholderiales bacterium]
MHATPAAAVTRALRQHRHRRDALVQILRAVQEHTGWLPRPVLAQVAQGLGLTPAVVEGVASFYRFFHLQPVGRYHLLWSDHITDRMRGSRALAQALCARLELAPGQVRADALASVGTTSCTGLADQGPALLVNQHQVLTRMDGERVRQLADLVLGQVPVPDWPAEWMQVDDNIQRADVLLGSPPLRGEALQATVGRGAQATLDALEASRLRGRGGAGFATARKWALCRAAPLAAGATRVVVCNADEGEPGTFKDRVLLQRQADTVFEGMTVAARLLGARQGLMYLRGEYRFLLASLQAVLARRRARGLLGRHILGCAGFDFDIAIHVGAGAYVCGEESALIESLEGKRGTPRIRPPFPVEQGYLGQPTIVNNVETFCAAARIAQHGDAWWSARGTAHSSGTRLHSVSGDCARPGIYEYPLGVSVAQVLHDCGAHATQAVQVGGPSGTCIAAPEFDRRLCFEDLPTAGAFTVFDRSRDMFEVAHSFARFFAHESCGFCTPCRVGTQLVLRRMDKLAAGLGSVWDRAELDGLDALMQGTTHCGLGASSTRALRDTLQRFGPAYARRLRQHSFVPGFDLDAELESARRATGRDDAHAHLEQHE